MTGNIFIIWRWWRVWWCHENKWFLDFNGSIIVQKKYITKKYSITINITILHTFFIYYNQSNIYNFSDYVILSHFYLNFRLVNIHFQVKLLLKNKKAHVLIFKHTLSNSVYLYLLPLPFWLRNWGEVVLSLFLLFQNIMGKKDGWSASSVNMLTRRYEGKRIDLDTIPLREIV